MSAERWKTSLWTLIIAVVVVVSFSGEGIKDGDFQGARLAREGEEGGWLVSYTAVRQWYSQNSAGTR